MLSVEASPELVKDTKSLGDSASHMVRKRAKGEPILYWPCHHNVLACACQSEEMRNASSHLVGRRIDGSVPQQYFITISIRTLEPIGKLLTVFMARNELTEVTALGFLHMMHHLSEESGVLLDVNPSRKGNNRASLDWQLIQPDGFVLGSSYKFPRPRCNRMSASAELSATVVPKLTRFYSQCHTLCDVRVPEGMAFSDALRMIESSGSASGGPLVKKRLELPLSEALTAMHIDPLVGYLQQTPVNFKRLPESVVFRASFPRRLIPWPGTCPRESGVLLVRNESGELGMKTLEYRFANPGGKEFRVRLCVSHFSESLELHVLFS